MLKLIVNNTHPLKGNAQPQGRQILPFNNSFIFDFQKFSSNLHVFRVKDRIHELACEMTLEVKETLVSLEEGKEGVYLAPIVACSLPTINLQKFNEKMGFDAYLQRLIMAQFQVNILEQLLLFCEQQDAVNLILTIKEDNLDYLEIYSRFSVTAGQVAKQNEEHIEFVMPMDMGTYDKVIDFVDKIDREFRSALWRGQSNNPALQEYLKSNACVQSFI